MSDRHAYERWRNEMSQSVEADRYITALEAECERLRAALKASEALRERLLDQLEAARADALGEADDE